jgi:hypothetical protein
MFEKEWELIYPISVGDQPALNVIKNTLNAESLIEFITSDDNVDGTYQELNSGSFIVKIEGESTDVISYNANDIVVANKLLALNTKINNITVVERSGVIDHYGRLYLGKEWNITFDWVIAEHYEGIIHVQVDANTITSSDSIVITRELQKGHGPYIPVDISFDQQHYTESRLLLEFIEPISLRTIYPTHGPYSGNTLIAITINEIHRVEQSLMSYEPYCLFGSAEVPARFISSTAIQCITPPHSLLEGGEEAIRIGINHQEITSDEMIFTYDSATTSVSIYPTFGTIHGGTIVKITGASILGHNCTGYCAFDDSIVRADLCVDGLMTCHTPSKSFVGEVTVTYTLNGVDYMNNTFLKYNYVEHPLVTRIDPIRGPTTGGTVVRVIGQNFNLGDTDVQCRFGDIVVDSEYYSSTSVACVAPPLKRNYEIQTIDASLNAFTPQTQTTVPPVVGPRIGSIRVTKGCST